MRSRLRTLLCGALALAACKASDGAPGQKGDSGTSVVVVPLNPGSTDCTFGGAQITSTGGAAFACNGAPGETGAQGEPGEPGTSVTVAALGDGSACEYGGSQIASGTTLSHACNGAPGLQGPLGPRLVLKTADGEVIGPAFPLDAQGRVAVFHLASQKPMFLSMATGRSVYIESMVFFDASGCGGSPWIGTPGSIVEAAGPAVRLYAAKSMVPSQFYAVSHSDDLASCRGYTYGQRTGYEAVQVLDSRYPYTAPLQLAYE